MPADQISINRKGPHTAVVVDGVQIPAKAIARNSVVVPVDPDDQPRVCLELIAGHVDVVNTLDHTDESETPHG